MKKLTKNSLSFMRLPVLSWRRFACLILTTGVLFSAVSLVAPVTPTASALPVNNFAAPATTQKDVNSDLSCGESDLNWIICPFVEGLISAIDAIDNLIINQLSV